MCIIITVNSSSFLAALASASWDHILDAFFVSKEFNIMSPRIQKNMLCVALESVDSNSATFGLQPPFLISSFLHIMSSQTHVHSHSSWMTNDPLWATTAKQQRRLAWFQFLGDNKEDTKNFRTKKWVSEKLSLTRAVGDLRVQHDKFPLPKGWFGNGSRMRCDTTQKLSPFV